MKKKPVLFLAAILFVSAAHAQLGVGLEAGCNLSNLQVQIPHAYTSIKSKSDLGYRGGLIAHIAANKDFSVLTGLYYVTKETDLSGTSQGYSLASHVQLSSFQCPVYVAAQPKGGRYGRFSIGAGVFADLHIRGQERSNDVPHEFNIGTTPKDDLKPFDFGLGIHAGYKLNNGLMIRAQYQLGLADISPSPNEKIQSRNFAITVAYFGPGQLPKAPAPAR